MSGSSEADGSARKREPATVAAQRMLMLSALPGVGRGALAKVARTVEIAAADWLAQAGDHCAPVARALDQVGAIEAADRFAQEQVASARARDARILCTVDPEYQSAWSGCPRLPPVLFVRGQLRQASQTVAVVGTRQPTAHGATIAFRIAAHLAGTGTSVLSGLALGCDGHAHAAALQCGGHTVAVLAHGLQMIAPHRHERLAEEILVAGGALVTEYPFGRGPQPYQFVERDDLQASMSRGVVLVQSGITGGSLHAARAAIRFGRWLAVAHPTQHDIDAHEAKIAANLVLAQNDVSQRCRFLACRADDLQRVHILESADDYPLLDAHLQERGS